jgi:hypothetical protein
VQRLEDVCHRHGLRWALVDITHDGSHEHRKMFLVGTLLEADGATREETFLDIAQYLERQLDGR